LSPRVRWTAQVIALVFLLTYLIWYPQVYKIVGESMTPSLQDGEKAMVIHQNYSISRFDIVILNNEAKLLIKRVVGLPGEEVEYINGRLCINSQRVSETFLYGFRRTPIEAYRFRLAADEYFVLGDNRPDSMDSRAFGPVKRKCIEGKMVFRIW